MTRIFFIERALRQIYGGQPSDDATISKNLVNSWLEDATAVAAKVNYTESIKIDGIAYTNGSFYTTYKSLTVTKDEQFLYKVQLPHTPVGLGTDEGVSTCIFSDGTKNSYPLIWMTQNQKAIHRGMRSIPNKILGYSEGQYVYAESTINLAQYTAKVCMVSAGDSTDLNSALNVPQDYFPAMVEYIKQQLVFERMQPVDVQSDGLDAIKTT
jgi:hypothetical protein